MAADNLPEKIQRGWANAPTGNFSLSEKEDLVLTDKEKAMLEKIAVAKMKSEGGDKSAKKQLAHLVKDVANLKAMAKHGDAKAKRTLLVLQESGIFTSTQKLDVSGWSRPKLDGPIYTEKDRLKFLGNKFNFTSNRAKQEGWDPATVLKMQQLASKGDKPAIAYLTKLDTFIRDVNWTDDQDPVGHMGYNGHWKFMRGGLGKEEAEALAGDGGSVEHEALCRHSSSGSSSLDGPSISNTVYRAVIHKQARKHAGHNGHKQPSTKDIFLAKAAVDKAIGKAGISLYMPGAQPGRRTI